MKEVVKEHRCRRALDGRSLEGTKKKANAARARNTTLAFTLWSSPFWNRSTDPCSHRYLPRCCTVVCCGRVTNECAHEEQSDE